MKNSISDAIIHSFIFYIFLILKKLCMYLYIYLLPPRGQFTTSLLWLQIMLEQRL